MKAETDMSGGQRENSNVADTESSRRDDADPRDPERLPALARRAVETFVSEGQISEAQQDAAVDSLLGGRAACFVSIKTVEGDLRGCIGTVEPTKPTLAEELIHNAISAATRDPRFLPVSASELPHLRYSVDVLSPPEPTRFSDLNPKTYGLIVEDGRGRRGLLLPDLEGVETAEQQFQITARKAGISSRAEDVKLYRFRVRRYGE
jgi:AmmeMemoRadiSam system protein A